MLDPTLEEADVQLRIRELTDRDPDAGKLAELAWNLLTKADGPCTVTLAGLQHWLWWLLPKDHPERVDFWTSAAAALADLFNLLGATRYATLCQSGVTREVFDGWSRSDSEGLATTRAALVSSGVEPPTLIDFAWGAIFGPWESQARDAVSRALETALDKHRLDLASEDWKAVARDICETTLDTAHPSGIGQTWRMLIATERAEGWAGSRTLPTGQRAERQKMVGRYVAAPPMPPHEDIQRVLEPLIWMADRCAAGCPLTPSHHLPAPLVAEAVSRFGWWDRSTPPNSESDVPQLDLLRSTATTLRIIRRAGNSLVTTDVGADFQDHFERWWGPFTDTLGGTGEYEHGVTETVVMALLDTPMTSSTLNTTVVTHLTEQGWSRRGDELSVDTHRWAIADILGRWQAWGLLEPKNATDDPAHDDPDTLDLDLHDLDDAVDDETITFTPTGRAALERWLHRRITSPLTRT